MKIKSIIFFIFLLIAHPSFSQTGEKILVSSINPQGQKILKIELEKPVEIERWKGEVIRVMTTVSIGHVNEAVLKSLVTAGRYRIASAVENELIRLTSPAMHKEISLGGNPITESISYLIYVPEGMIVEIENTDPFKLISAENNP